MYVACVASTGAKDEATVVANLSLSSTVRYHACVDAAKMCVADTRRPQGLLAKMRKKVSKLMLYNYVFYTVYKLKDYSV